MLDVSKVEAGKLELYPVDFEIRPCLAAAVRTLEFRAREKSLGFSWGVDSDVPTHVRGDSQRLRQVLINLLGNAIKFTTEGEVRLNVSTIDCSDSGIHLQFRISDTGVGVPPEKQSMIFAPFEQADSSATRVHGGTGLGLAISRQLVGLMGGAICVESPWHDGSTGCFVRGSRFTFSARFAPGKELPKVIARPVASNGVQLRVLLTEDNPVNQLLARRLIEKLGHTVAIANDGVEAVELFDPTAIDVILMDIQMPRMDGFEASRAIRAKEKEQNVSRRTPIVALTAHALAGDRERCLDAGMDEYLTKPIHTKELARVLAEIAGQLPCSASIPAEMKSS
ncbi:MAG TPA: response regulator [Bryobacteraceae bacterium]|nr:response regulator [Bryobacteraceae bacterium]